MYTGRQLQTEYPLIITVQITYLAVKYVRSSFSCHLKQINEAYVTKKITNPVKLTNRQQEDSNLIHNYCFVTKARLRQSNKYVQYYTSRKLSHFCHQHFCLCYFDFLLVLMYFISHISWACVPCYTELLPDTVLIGALEFQE